MEPVTRPNVEDAYWHFAAERLKILERRSAGLSGPWTTDPILNEYKFCNTFRVADRVSQYLVRDVIYAPGEWTDEDVFLRTVLFRLFSKERTWDELEARLGPIRAETFDIERISAELDLLRGDQAIYTSAFILCATNAYEQPSKHRNHLYLVKAMLDGGLPRKVSEASSLRKVYELLIEYPLIGAFMGYQLAIDLNYSELLDFSENEFTVPGPGAVRGMKKVFEDTDGFTAEELILRMVERQDEEFAKRGLEFRGLNGRKLHAIDCQGLFCETDKYSRVAFPDLKSNRSRIKARFTPQGAVSELFLPPKWTRSGDGLVGEQLALPVAA